MLVRSIVLAPLIQTCMLRYGIGSTLYKFWSCHAWNRWVQRSKWPCALEPGELLHWNLEKVKAWTLRINHLGMALMGFRTDLCACADLLKSALFWPSVQLEKTVWDRGPNKGAYLPFKPGWKWTYTGLPGMVTWVLYKMPSGNNKKMTSGGYIMCWSVRMM